MIFRENHGNKILKSLKELVILLLTANPNHERLSKKKKKNKFFPTITTVGRTFQGLTQVYITEHAEQKSNCRKKNYY